MTGRSDGFQFSEQLIDLGRIPKESVVRTSFERSAAFQRPRAANAVCDSSLSRQQFSPPSHSFEPQSSSSFGSQPSPTSNPQPSPRGEGAAQRRVRGLFARRRTPATWPQQRVKGHFATRLGALAFCLLLPVLSAFGQSNPVPLINQPLVPDAVAPGSAGFTLTVNGTGFVQGSVVNWSLGGVTTPVVTTFVSSSQLTAAVPAANVAAAGTASVTVTNPSPGGGLSNAAPLGITTPTGVLSLSRTDFPTVYSPIAISAVDLNDDGKPDLVIAHFEAPGSVAVQLGNGDGTFQQPVGYATGEFPVALGTADFNGDGIIDLAVAGQHFNPGSLSILLGKGDGRFEPQISTPLGNGPSSLAVGDFNRDGSEDVAVVNEFDHTLWVLLGNGDGTFQAPSVAGDVPFPSVVTVGDFNRDGKLDLAVDGDDDTGNSAVAVLLGNGDGTFQSPEYFGTNGQDGITTSDFNGDGILDLAVAGGTLSRGGFISVLLGNGDGTFQPEVDYPSNPSSDQVITGDFNGDGKLDLANSGGSTGDTLAILLGNGDGTFQAPLQYSAGNGDISVTTADFDGDGTLDLATANESDNTFSVFLQANLPGASVYPTRYTFGAQPLGTTSSWTATLTNTGTATLNITSITASGDFSESNRCGSSLVAGASCNIRFTFRPLKVGYLTGSITITDNAQSSPQTVSLSGTGVAFELSATSLSFGKVSVGTSSQPQTVTITNESKSAQSISLRVTGKGGLEFTESNNCGSSLPGGASCSATVSFAPKSGGYASATLNISSSGSNQTVALSGTGTK